MAGNLTAMIAAIFSGGVTADPYYEYTTLLLPGNGTNGAQNNTFLDASTNNFTITRNGNTTQGTFSPFSQTGWGNYFDGTNDSLTVSSNAAFGFGTGDFCVEFWMYPTALTSARGIYLTYVTNGIYLYTDTSNKLIVRSAAVANLITSNDAISLNTWTHVAVCRTGTTLSLYLNGSRTAGGTAVNSTNFAAGDLYIGAEISTFYYSGYLGSLRVVKGSAVYDPTALTITVPTAPLSAVSGTSLLTCQYNRFRDASPNNFTITANNGVAVQAFSPFNPTASWSAATNGGSGYFDGSGDYLTTPANAAFQVGTGDFTIECWLYLSATGVNDGVITECRSSNASSTGFVFNTRQATGGYKLNFYTDGAGNTASTTLPYNMWNHVAVSRSGTTVRLFANGVVDLTFTKSNNYTDNPGVQIGQSTLYTSSNITGYMQGLRFVKGTAVYTGAFTPPIAPLSTSGAASASAYSSTTNVNTSFASSETSLLLNFTNAGIYDATSKNDLETVGNAQISTAISAKWGSGSMAFDGTGDYLASAATNLPLTFNTGDFTIEGWLYPASVSGGSFTIVSNRFDAGADTVLIFGFGTTYGLYFHTQNTFLLSSGTNLTANTWQNVVLCRASGTVRIFLDGTQVGSTSSAQNLSSTASMFVGQDGTRTSPALQYNGYMQDVRITKGYARYVTGTGANAGKMVFNGTNDLALPTAAFPTL
jgi:Concanavalin A-like lectin/glucanases superfamily